MLLVHYLLQFERLMLKLRIFNETLSSRALRERVISVIVDESTDGYDKRKYVESHPHDVLAETVVDWVEGY